MSARPLASAAVIHDAGLLAKRLPDDGVAHHREVEDDRAVVEEAILPEHAEPRLAGNRDAPTRRRLVFRDDLEERGLPGAVRADEAVTRSRVQLEGDVVEQRASAVGLFETREANHWRPLSAGPWPALPRFEPGRWRQSSWFSLRERFARSLPAFAPVREETRMTVDPSPRWPVRISTKLRDPLVAPSR